MEDLDSIARSTARGSFLLFIGTIFSTAINAITSIALGRLLGPDLYGLYSLSLTPASLLLLGTGFGVNVAIIKFIAEYNRKKQYNIVSEIISSSLLFQLIISIILAFILYVFAEPFSIYVINRPEAVGYVRLTSILLIGQVLFTTLNSVFQGFNNMGRSSLITLLQSISKFFIAIPLVILGFGVYGAVSGHVYSYLISGIVGLMFITLYFRDKTPFFNTHLIKMMIIYGIPVYINSVIMGLLGVYRNYLFSIFISNVEIGNFMAASNLTTAVVVFAGPISASLFPQFSRLDPNKEINLIKSIFNASVVYSTFIILPISVFLMGFSKDVIYLFYGSKYTYAPLYLSLLTIQFILVGIGSIVLPSFLNGLGKTKVLLYSGLISLAVSIPLYIPLIHLLSTVGIILSIVIAISITVFYLIHIAYREFNIELRFRKIIRIYFSTFTPLILLLILRYYLNLGRSIYNILFFGSLYLFLYLLILPLCRGITLEDLNNLETAFKSVKIFSYLINPILKFEKILIEIIKS